MCVVDLGAAPGGWSQYVARQVGPEGAVVAVDLLPMEPIPGVQCVHADFSDEAGLHALLKALSGRSVDLVLSDMAPNISGIRAVDQPRAMALAELALDLVPEVAAPGAGFVVKLFEGEGVDALVDRCRSRFARVRRYKPKASRPESREWYLVAERFTP